jgi:kumamolisin
MKKQAFPKWLPREVAEHYDFPLNELDGSQQSVAIISLGGKLDIDELRQNFTGMGAPIPSLEIHDINSDSIGHEQNNASTTETHLDVEVIGSICPNATVRIYRGANNGGPGFAEALAAAVEADNSVISISWGRPEIDGDNTSALEEILQVARKLDITVCVSAGDGGSSGHRNGLHAIPAPDNKAHVEYPASSPHVISCGGTQLLVKGKDYKEVVWNNSGPKYKSSATGGGVSRLFSRPLWQDAHGVDITSVNSGESGRVVPDVSGIAAGGDWLIYENSESKIAGGTSAVAPLMASLVVLANQKRALIGKSRLGFITDKLYEIATAKKGFVSITQGHNKPAPKYPGYTARPGHDACTGLGSPRARELINELTKLA